MKTKFIKLTLWMILILAVFSLAGCQVFQPGDDDDDDNSDSSSTTTTTTSAAGAPTVSSVSPSDGATGQSVNPTIAVTFSEAMDTTTITANTSTTSCSGTIQLSKDDFSSCVVLKESPAASSSDTVFSVDPKANLDFAATYKVKVTTAAKDTSDTALAEDSVTTSGFTSIAATELSTTVTPLQVGSKMSVVEAKTSSAEGNSKLAAIFLDYPEIQKAIDVTGFAATTDYAEDETFVFVHDDTGQALNTINEILCYFDQIEADRMLNRGDYKAQVDETQCESKGGSSSSSSTQGQSGTGGSSNNVTYTYWTVNSTRADDESPMVVKAWIEPSENDAQFIKARMTIYEGKSATNKLGVFRLDFIGYQVDSDDNPTDETSMVGFMSADATGDNRTLLEFYNYGTEEEAGFTMDWEEAVVVNRSGDGSEGYGTTQAFDWETAMTSGTAAFAAYNFAYNDDYFYRVKSDNTKVGCLNRNDFHETAWRYGLYKSDGSRFSINSGFPIKATGTDGSDYYGYVGYWGLWMPEEAGLSSGSEVTKEEFDQTTGSVTGDTYTLFQVDGKLRKYTKKTLTLDEIKNIPFSKWDDTTGSETQMYWNGTSIMKRAVRDSTTNWQWQALDTETAYTFSAGDWGFFFYSEALGGNGQIKYDNWDAILADFTQTTVPTVSGSSAVIFHVEDVVFPGDSGIPTALTCFENCPDPDKLGEADAYFDIGWDASTGKDYTFDASTMLLKYEGTNVVWPATTTASSEENFGMSGVWSGAMFENTTENIDKLKCPWDANSICAWQAWEKLSEYYTWETGPDQWFKLSLLKDADGNYLTFEPPVQVKYTHRQTDSTKRDAEFNGTTFYLDYEGFGNLFGIPEACVNVNTGEEVDCWNISEDDMMSGNIRWMRKFVIPNGSLVIGTDTAATEYVTKALEVEQKMKKADESVCTGEGLSLTSYDLPDTTGVVDPEIGDKPSVSAPPAVVGGVVQITLD